MDTLTRMAVGGLGLAVLGILVGGVTLSRGGIGVFVGATAIASGVLLGGIAAFFLYGMYAISH